MKKLSDFDRGLIVGLVFALLAVGFSYVVLNIDEWSADQQSTDFERPGSYTYFETEKDPELPSVLGEYQDREGNYHAYVEYPSSARPNGEYVYIWGIRPVYNQDLGVVVFYDFEITLDAHGSHVSSAVWGGWSDVEIAQIGETLSKQLNVTGEEIP